MSAINSKNTWIHVGEMLNGIDDYPLLDVHVVYNEDQIVFVGQNGKKPPKHLFDNGKNEPDHDYSDQIMLPGLIEAHAHLFLEGNQTDFDTRKSYLQKEHDELLSLAKGRLERLIQLGIMGVRDAGDKNGVGLAISKLYKSDDKPLMPYVDSPGAAIHHKGRYGSFMADPMEDFDSIEKCVQSRVKLGADRIKLIPTGIINFKQGQMTKEPQMNLEELKEFVRVAKSLNKQTFAHASGDDGIEMVIEAGINSVEHGFFIRDDQLSRMRDKQIAWVPTFAPVQMQVDLKSTMGWDENIVNNLQKILDNHAKSLLKASKMGVPIIAGSDAGSFAVGHGNGFLYELEIMEKAGVSNAAIINSATGVSSSLLGYNDAIGKIEKGYKSRFIITKHSPLVKMNNLRKEKIIIFDGYRVDSPLEINLVGL